MGVELVRSCNGRGSKWLLVRAVNMGAGVEEIIGSFLTGIDGLGVSLPSDLLAEAERPEEVAVGRVIRIPLLVLAPSLTPRDCWLLLSVSPKNERLILDQSLK